MTFFPVFFSFASSWEEQMETTLVTVRGSISNNPSCVLNDDKLIDIDFGRNIRIPLIDGFNYSKEIIVSVKCENFDEEDLVFKISANNYENKYGLLATSKEGLGIIFTHNSSVLPVDEFVNIDQNGIINIVATPVIYDSTEKLTVGEFVSQALLVVAYP